MSLLCTRFRGTLDFWMLLSSEQIRFFIDNIVSGKSNDIDVAVVDRAVKVLRVPMSIHDPKARMIHYVNDLFQLLKGEEHGDMRITNRKQLLSCEQVPVPERVTTTDGEIDEVRFIITEECESVH